MRIDPILAQFQALTRTPARDAAQQQPAADVYAGTISSTAPPVQPQPALPSNTTALAALAAVPAPAVAAMAADLVAKGVQFQTRRKFLFWATPFWRQASADDVTRVAQEGKSDRLKAQPANTDKWLRVDSVRHLVDLAGFYGSASPAALAAPALAQALQDLEPSLVAGTTRQRFMRSDVTEEGAAGAYGAYHYLLGEPDGMQSLHLDTGGKRYPLRSPEDAVLAAFLQGKAPTTGLSRPALAESLKAVTDAGCELSSGDAVTSYRALQASTEPVEIRFKRNVLARVPLADLEKPAELGKYLADLLKFREALPDTARSAADKIFAMDAAARAELLAMLPDARGWHADGTWTRVDVRPGVQGWSDSPGAPYPNNADYSLTGPELDLRGLKNCSLSLKAEYEFERNYDYCHVEVSTDRKHWTNVLTITESGREKDLKADLSAYDGKQIRVRFRIRSDNSTNMEGITLYGARVQGTAGSTQRVIALDEPLSEAMLGKLTAMDAPRLAALHTMRDAAGSLDDGVRMWEALASSWGQPDFQDRQDALVQLSRAAGLTAALDLWPSLDAMPDAERKASLTALHTMATSLKGFEQSLALWPHLVPHRNAADFPDRCAALADLTRRLGRDKATAFWPQVDGLSASDRKSSLATVESIGQQLHNLEGALTLWPLLAAHRTDADFAERVQALSTLAQRVGVEQAVVVWPSIDQASCGTLPERVESYEAARILAASADGVLAAFKSLDASRPTPEVVAALQDVARPRVTWQAAGTWQQVPGKDGAWEWNDSPDGPYPDNADYSVTSSVVDLTNVKDPVLSVHVKHALEKSYDYCSLEGSMDGQTWTPIERWTDQGEGLKKVSLNQFNLCKVQLRFRITSDKSANLEGVTLRDIKLEGRDKQGRFTLRLDDHTDASLEQQLLSVATDASLAVAQRAANLRTIQAMARATDGVTSAAALWPTLAPHTAAPDFDNRRDVLCALTREVGTKRALEAWTLLEPMAPPQRDVHVQLLQRSGALLDDPVKALDLWRSQRTHLADPDFTARVDARASLVKRLGAEAAENFWPRLDGMPAAERISSMAAIDRMAADLKDSGSDPGESVPLNPLAKALQLWEDLEKHRLEPDFNDRVSALSGLAVRLGVDKARAAWPAFDALEPADRARSLVRVGAMAQSLDSLENALALWPAVAAQRDAADIDDRAAALTALAKRHGVTEALAAWPTVCGGTHGTFVERGATFDAVDALGRAVGDTPSAESRAQLFMRLDGAGTGPAAVARVQALCGNPAPVKADGTWQQVKRADGTWAWSDSPDGNYKDDANTSLTLGPIAIAGLDDLRLEYEAEIALEARYDYLRVEVSEDGQAWRELASLTGTEPMKARSDNVGGLRGSRLFVRFRLTSDRSGNAEGVSVRGVTLRGRGAGGGSVVLRLDERLDEAQVARVAALATTGSHAQRDRNLDAVQKMARALGSGTRALELWPQVESHAADADFAQRFTALCELVRDGGETLALSVWKSIETLPLARRDAVMANLRAMGTTLDSCAQALELWPALQAHEGEADFADRCGALATLGRRLGLEPAREFWKTLDALPAADRTASLARVETLGSKEDADGVKLWGLLAAHRHDADFAARFDACQELARDLGTERALTAWPVLADKGQGTWPQRLETFAVAQSLAGGANDEDGAALTAFTRLSDAAVEATVTAALRVLTADGGKWDAQGTWQHVLQPNGTWAWDDSPSGKYQSKANFALTSPQISLHGIVDPSLEFHAQHDLEANFDKCLVEVSVDGRQWEEVKQFTSRGSSDVKLDLKQWAEQKITVRFRMTSDGSTEGTGVVVSGIQLSGTDQASGDAVRRRLDERVNPDAAQQLLDLVTQSPPAARMANLQTLQWMARELGGTSQATRIWQVLQPHVAAADFENRKEILTALAMRGGVDLALAVWPSLEPLSEDERIPCLQVMDLMSRSVPRFSDVLQLWPGVAPRRLEADFEQRALQLSDVAAKWDVPSAMQAWPRLDAMPLPQRTAQLALLDRLSRLMEGYEKGHALWQSEASTMEWDALRMSAPEFEDGMIGLTALTAKIGEAGAKALWPTLRANGSGRMQDRVSLYLAARALAEVAQPVDVEAAWRGYYDKLCERKAEASIGESLQTLAPQGAAWENSGEWARVQTWTGARGWEMKGNDRDSSSLTSQPLFLDGMHDSALHFKEGHALSMSCDLDVSEDGGSTWTTLDTYSGDGPISRFRKGRKVDLSDYDGKAIRIRFRASTDYYHDRFTVTGLELHATGPDGRKAVMPLEESLTRDYMGDLLEAATDPAVPLAQRTSNLEFLAAMPPGWARRVLTFVRDKREVGTFGDQSLGDILQRATMAITVSDDLDKALANFIKAAKAPGKVEKKDGELRIGGIRITPKAQE